MSCDWCERWRSRKNLEKDVEKAVKEASPGSRLADLVYLLYKYSPDEYSTRSLKLINNYLWKRTMAVSADAREVRHHELMSNSINAELSDRAANKGLFISIIALVVSVIAILVSFLL